MSESESTDSQSGEVKAATTTITNSVINQQTFKMTGVIGNIEVFNFDKDNFSEYLERFQYIFTLNNITEDSMKTALIMSMAGKEFHSKVTHSSFLRNQQTLSMMN